MEIRLLTEETISRISAGEVIERPLNVVKELVENSIDAGSTAVTVEIRDGGIRMIRVTDNGCGIEKDQIARAFVRHATSKIKDAEDLSHLSSLGFRGEALASIAAVAQVEMITKVRGALSGTRAVNDHLAAYSPDAPVQIDLEEIGAPDGTTVIVRNLFGKIPVRRKFLRQPQTEAGYITDLMEKQALSHPLISFHYRVNGQDKLHTTGNGNLRELIYRIYGRETAGAIIPIHAEDPDTGMTIDGFLGKPEVSRSSRSFETFFINGRMLRSKELSAGLEEGYRTDLMQHRFPFAVLHLTMPPEHVDVNVHPSKMEVRFTDRRAVFQFLDTSVHNALSSVELIPRANLNTAREERAQSRKEAQLRQKQLQKGPHYEAFEKGRTDRLPTRPAVSSANAAGQADSSARPVPSGISSASAALQAVSDDQPAQSDSSAVDSGKQADIPAPSRHGGSAIDSGRQADAALPAASEDFVFEDRRPYGTGSLQSQSRQEDSRVHVPDRKDDTPEETAALPQGQLSLENLFAASAADACSRTEGEADHILTPQKAENFKYIGQIFGTYWIIEYEKRLLIIDQHAAHEKVNYERMMRRIEGRQASEVASQQLMPPIVLRLSGREENAYQQFQDVFASMGYEIEDFGGGSYAIRAVPTELFGQTADSLLREILEEIMNERISGTPQVIISKVASMSCKAAVKGNSRLSEAEARALIGELLTLENPYHCPHGRPTMIVMTQYEVDRKFKRIV